MMYSVVVESGEIQCRYLTLAISVDTQLEFQCLMIVFKCHCLEQHVDIFALLGFDVHCRYLE